MNYRRISIVWLKLFCVPLITACSSFGAVVILYKTIGLSYWPVTPVERNELKEVLKRSSWCFHNPKYSGNGLREYMECGMKDNGEELLPYALVTNSKKKQ